MRRVDKAPGAAAVFLYRQVDRDDESSVENVYERIKILTEEGRKYATVEISYLKGDSSIWDIEARTIRPDGSIVVFRGTIFDQSIVQANGVKLNSKTLNLSDVEVGGIVEYRYRRRFDSSYVFNSHWILSADLFTRYGKFSLLPNRNFTLRWAWPAGIPQGSKPPEKDKGRIRMEVHDVAAFVTEEDMPPAADIQEHVDFVYLSNEAWTPQKDPEKFWQEYFKSSFKSLSKFMDEPRAMQKDLEQIVSPTDTPDQKLQKIYARVQQMRNLTFEREMSKEELKHQGIHDLDSVKDVWLSGYGGKEALNLLFLALAKAAGIEGNPVQLATRDRHIFDRRLQNPNDLNVLIAEISIGGKQLFLDPGCKFTPFGDLPWYESGVEARRLDRDGGSWVRTTAFDSKHATIARSANLRLDEHGSLEGEVTVTYSGQQALMRRLQERDEDAAERKKYLERQLERDLDSGADVALSNEPEWDKSSSQLVAQYHVSIPGWAASAGQRSLFPVALFGGREKSRFTHAARVHPLYFSYAHSESDEVTVSLAPRWKAASIPQVSPIEKPAFSYSMNGSETDGVLHLQRSLRCDFIFAAVDAYGTVQTWFDGVRSGDEQQAVLTAMNEKAKH